MQGSSVPPGFVPSTSFLLKKVETVQGSPLPVEESEKCSTPSDSIPSVFNADFHKQFASKNRPWIVDGLSEKELKYDSDDGFECLYSRPFLPSGVVRGCPSCADCLKVVARWHPEDSHLPLLEEAPVFHPTEEEFKDTLNYVASIRSRVKEHGICRIVPPKSWQPPPIVEEKKTWETSKFVTHIQHIDELGDLFMKKRLHRAHLRMRRKRKRSSIKNLILGSFNGANVVDCQSDIFRFESGPEFTLQSFKNYADDFKSQYFSKSNINTDRNVSSTASSKSWKPSIQDIEGEYWRIIESPIQKLEVFRAANLDARVFKSEFTAKRNGSKMPKSSVCIQSGWNLKNTPVLQGSLLRYETCSTSSILDPQLVIGMCLSSSFWKIEEHHLYSLCYMHLGAPRVWYVIPHQYRPKFEEIVKNHFPESSKHPWLLLNVATQIPPSTLISEGIPVYRCVQYPKEFVLIFPGSYHSQVDCGFNCSEAVNFAPYDWLPHGQLAVERYSDFRRKTSISYDKLLLKAAGEAIKALCERLFVNDPSDHLQWTCFCGKDGILAKALKARVKSEEVRQKYLCITLQKQVMEDDVDTSTKRECVICFYDLHLSAVGCSCSPDRYTCLRHVKLLCSCEWSSRCLFYRYDMSELTIMVEALEGKRSALYTWAKEKLRLILQPHLSEDQRSPDSTD
ncbi:unnamed protein product [Cuscuta epithymum]|uniref:Lysine-specific demethylase JMJ16 n=1 Tax=Cuscuta epithymum TaxID=186058 RepID=A0AAV0CGH4_9ASTE|nr:unnamed protein product [Cuscuta epithymum]CAH9132821.1 unnamed protein product [Cuscuta epithymum]